MENVVLGHPSPLSFSEDLSGRGNTVAVLGVMVTSGEAELGSEAYKMSLSHPEAHTDL